MGLLGDGAMVFWHDLAEGTDQDYQEWHSKQHLAERLGVPGFQRGYRFAALEGAPAYFVMYEVDDLAVLTSKGYLDRLNDPTPWTRRALGHFRNSNRTLCRVVASVGGGIPGLCLTVRCSAMPGAADGLRAWLADDLLPGLVARPGLLGAHLLEGDPGASQTETAEKGLRERPDEIADLVILVAGYQLEALCTVRDGDLAPAALASRGAAAGAVAGIHGLRHAFTAADLGG